MKKVYLIIPMALFLCFMISCQNKETLAELEGYRTRAEVEEQNTAIAKRYIEAINKGEFDTLNEFLTPDYGVYSPSGYPEPTSREKLIESYKGAAQAFSSFVWKLEDIIAAEEKVICRIKIQGETKPGVPGMPENGKAFEFSMISVMRFENGKIVEEWQEDDQLGFARQLGMELGPKTEKK